MSCSAPLHLLLECQAEDCRSLRIKLLGFKLGEDPVWNKLRIVQFDISSSDFKAPLIPEKVRTVPNT